MKSRAICFGLIVIVALTGCEMLPGGVSATKETQESNTSKDAGEPRTSIAKSGAERASTTAPATIHEPPADVDVLVDQLSKFDAAFNSGDIDAYNHSFDPGSRFLGRYPIWNDLDCQADEQRLGAIWCAYGRMGHPEDRELEEELIFLGNADVLTSGLRCSEVLCINQEGHPVGVVQIQMRQWIALNCKRGEDLTLMCS